MSQTGESALGGVGGEDVTGPRPHTRETGALPPSILTTPSAGDTGEPQGAMLCCCKHLRGNVALSHEAEGPQGEEESVRNWHILI